MVHRGRFQHGHEHRPGHRTAGRGRAATRCRWWDDDEAAWAVHARVERFVEPALLLALRSGEAHGYGLADAIEAIDPDDRVDLGNLYRLLRSLEDEGFVRSKWRDDLPGRSKRTYALTDDGRALLDTWASALRRAESNIGDFLRRYEEGKDR